MNDKPPDRPAIWFPTVRTGTGTDVFTIRLAEALNRRGIRAEIAWLPLRAEYAPWTVKPPNAPAWANIVHINSWLHRRFIPKRLPLVVTLHSCVHDPAFAPYKTLARTLYHRFWVKACESHTIGRANTVTAVSRYTTERAKQLFRRADILAIHNWIDTEIYCPSARRAPNRPFRLLFVGKPSRRKGTDLLPEIMRQLGTDFELRYTGTPKDLGTKSNVPANSFSLGWLSGDASLANAYRDCDALLFPSRLEGFGLVALEAQACGRPVIATDGSSLPEVIAQNETGILCPVDQHASYVAAARRLRDQPDVWMNMSLAARQRAVRVFSENIVIDSWVALYHRLNDA